ncbi:hypothetical protein B0H17DRAFT_1126986 [Mycena rosella]|uniref:Uncharacterized protein n=1 Tax=Mycena rosella TaxID=1033263 RepID=A0AAD7M6R7_MYCRO|nr:hypothetical protein B0H17DRAFT_1126986 [Mycena rosella]
MYAGRGEDGRGRGRALETGVAVRRHTTDNGAEMGWAWALGGDPALQWMDIDWVGITAGAVDNKFNMTMGARTRQEGPGRPCAASHLTDGRQQADPSNGKGCGPETPSSACIYVGIGIPSVWVHVRRNASRSAGAPGMRTDETELGSASRVAGMSRPGSRGPRSTGTGHGWREKGRPFCNANYVPYAKKVISGPRVVWCAAFLSEGDAESGMRKRKRGTGGGREQERGGRRIVQRGGGRSDDEAIMSRSPQTQITKNTASEGCISPDIQECSRRKEDAVGESTSASAFEGVLAQSELFLSSSFSWGGSGSRQRNTAHDGRRDGYLILDTSLAVDAITADACGAHVPGSGPDTVHQSSQYDHWSVKRESRAQDTRNQNRPLGASVNTPGAAAEWRRIDGTFGFSRISYFPSL